MSLRNIISVTLLSVATMLSAQSVTFPFSRITMLFGGDLMQHESQLNAARQPDGQYSYSPCYDHIRETVSNADIAIANLETTIGERNYSGYPSFCAPDSFLYAAKGAGFDVLLFANNHCLDKGKRGALRTLQMLDSLDIKHCGVYRDSIDRERRNPLIVNKNNFRIAILNYTYGTNGIPIPKPLIVNLIDKESIANDILKAKRMGVDAIIACMHWGDEYVSLPPTRIKELSEWLILQGVDHIIGNHPHVLQPMEIRRDTLTPRKSAVVYSLGNLISGMYARKRDGGALVELKMKKLFDICLLESLSYGLTWVARPNRDNVKNFTIIPAATSPIKTNGITKEKIQEFLNDSRSLFDKYNTPDITEFLFEQKETISNKKVE